MHIFSSSARESCAKNYLKFSNTSLVFQFRNVKSAASDSACMAKRVFWKRKLICFWLVKTNGWGRKTNGKIFCSATVQSLLFPYCKFSVLQFFESLGMYCISKMFGYFIFFVYFIFLRARKQAENQFSFE